MTAGEGLAAREREVLRAVVARLVPPAPGLPGAGELGVAERIERELRFHPRLRSDLRDALRLIEWWPLVTRLSRFTHLSAAEQDAELAAAASSRFGVRRSAIQGLKFLTMFFHYTQPATWTAIGYDGPWVVRKRPASVA